MGSHVGTHIFRGITKQRVDLFLGEFAILDNRHSDRFRGITEKIGQDFMDQSVGMGVRLGWKFSGHRQPHGLLRIMCQIQQDFAVQALPLAKARPCFRRQVRLAFELKRNRQIVHRVAQHLLHLGSSFPDDSVAHIVNGCSRRARSSPPLHP